MGQVDSKGQYGLGGGVSRDLQMADLEGIPAGQPEPALRLWDEEAQALAPALHVEDGARDEDADVAAERERVCAAAAGGGAAQRDSLRLVHLRKVYKGDPPKVAVEDLCLGVAAGERFGLLGPNGAGKTTTLAMLTGRARPTGGDALVNGESAIHGTASSRALLGFCPQQDPLLDLLTAEEHLSLYARLKGVAEEDVAGEVQRVLKRVALPAEMAHRPAGQYSGGSKRKLALGIALVGGVDALLLDEPSSGMDPGARRAMWNFIVEATEASSARHEAAAAAGAGAAQQPDLAVVLTTHNMEECEALCTRIGIMHQGRLRCLGSSSHLKLRFGGGYVLEVHAADDEALQARLAAFVSRELGGQELEPRHFGRAKFRLDARCQSMGAVFRLMESAKQDLGVAAYGLSMPTLEQVFLEVVGENLQG